MSERERWIIYPLLFLSLGVALRDELFDRTWSKSVVCEQLIALQEDPTNPQLRRLIAVIGRTEDVIQEPATGAIRVDTVLARQVIAENYAFSDGAASLSDRIRRIVALMLSASAEQARGGAPPVAEVATEEETAVNTDEVSIGPENVAPVGEEP